jgi:hypothetical protein
MDVIHDRLTLGVNLEDDVSSTVRAPHGLEHPFICTPETVHRPVGPPSVI